VAGTCVTMRCVPADQLSFFAETIPVDNSHPVAALCKLSAATVSSCIV
jgi:hypothetical protein